MSSTEKDDDLNDLITCSVCYETYTDPIILPCIHTFCLTCLELIGTYTFKNSGDQLPCPLCSQKFTIPDDGFAALQKNFFMLQLIEVTTAQRGVVGVDLCDQHVPTSLLMYCEDCNKVLCLVCLRECHGGHRMWDLITAAENLRSRLQRNAAVCKLCMSYGLKKKERIRKQKDAFVLEIQELKIQVEKARSDQKSHVDLHANMLLMDLDLHQKKRIEAFDNQEKELDKHLDCLKDVDAHCTDLASTDQHASILCKMTSELNEQINGLELMNKSIVDRALCSFEIYFKKAATTLSEVDKTINILGEIKAHTDYYIGRPCQVMTIEIGDTADDDRTYISGMAVANNELFILHQMSSDVSIYDMYTHKRRKQMSLVTFVKKVELRHCLNVDEIFYIVNGSVNEILQIDRNQEIKRWSTEDGLIFLSVSPESTIIATCRNTNTLQEYSLQGTLLHETKLCPTIVYVLHAIKLCNGHFVISHGKCIDHQVSLVNDSGHITKSFVVFRDSSIQQFVSTTILVVDKDGNILVLDKDNSRILLLSRDLVFRRELLSKRDGLQNPVAMHLDEENSRILIADNFGENFCKNGRVLVFDINK